jgi:hypothetical protein
MRPKKNETTGSSDVGVCNDLEALPAGFWRNKSLDHYLWQDTDGFMARHYSKDLLADTFNTFSQSTSVATYGQDADAVPLPRYLRKYVVPLISEKKLSEWANKRGAFLHVNAMK